MKRRSAGFRAAGLVAVLFAAAAAGAQPAPVRDETAAGLQAKIAAAGVSNRLVCKGELVCGIAELPRFYAGRAYKPAWVAEGSLSDAADELIQAVAEAEADGLRPDDYHFGSLKRLAAELRSRSASGGPIETGDLVDLDFLLTDAFLLLASHLLAGRVNPESLHAEWGVTPPAGVDLAGILKRGLDSGSVAGELNGMRPAHPGYAALKNELRRHREMRPQGGWPTFPEKASWKPGQAGETAEILRRRLESAGDLPPAGPADAGGVDDPALAEALGRYQARHGLEATRRLDPATLAVLNETLEERIRKIELNLERWRWVPRDLGVRHIWVNAPDFNLDVVEDGQAVLGMRVVVGRHYRKTPVISADMQYLVFNPDWNIPTRIAVEDILPKIRKDPGYMGREGIRVFESWAKDAGELDPAEVDWSSVTAKNFRFKLKKDPGPKNDLGRVKFMFPNKHSVYLHDTTSRRLFERGMRGFSSGCIRVEKPLELAEYVLRGAPGWSRDAVAAAIAAGERRSVTLPQKIPVHLVYFTAWADADARLQLRPDIYRRDPVLDKALSALPPRP
jgi:murein L,D-transpeptidase YcbB/YkuD